MSSDTSATLQGDTVTDTHTSEFVKTPVTAYSATGEEVAPNTFVQTEAAPTPVATPAPVQETPATDLPLPKTASSVPLIGLIGLIAMVAAFGLAVRAKRSA